MIDEEELISMKNGSDKNDAMIVLISSLVKALNVNSGEIRNCTKKIDSLNQTVSDIKTLVEVQKREADHQEKRIKELEDLIEENIENTEMTHVKMLEKQIQAFETEKTDKKKNRNNLIAVVLTALLGIIGTIVGAYATHPLEHKHENVQKSAPTSAATHATK